MVREGKEEKGGGGKKRNTGRGREYTKNAGLYEQCRKGDYRIFSIYQGRNLMSALGVLHRFVLLEV